MVQNYWKSGPQTIKTILNCPNFIASFQPCGPYQAINILPISEDIDKVTDCNFNLSRSPVCLYDRNEAATTGRKLCKAIISKYVLICIWMKMSQQLKPARLFNEQGCTLGSLIEYAFVMS